MFIPDYWRKPQLVMMACDNIVNDKVWNYYMLKIEGIHFLSQLNKLPIVI